MASPERSETSRSAERPPIENADLALCRHPPRVTGGRAPSKKLHALSATSSTSRNDTATRSVVKTGAMTFLEAALEILRHEGKPLHYKELTERALGKKLLTFVGRTPEVTMQTQLTAAVKKAPGNPFVRVKPGIFGLLRYPEVTAEEREAYAKADAPAAPAPSKRRTASAAGRGRDGAGGRERAGDERRGRRAGTGDAGGGGGARRPRWRGRAGVRRVARRRQRRGRGGAAAGEHGYRRGRAAARAGCRPRRAPPHWPRRAFSRQTTTRTTGDEEDDDVYGRRRERRSPPARATKQSTATTRMRATARRRSWRRRRGRRLARPARVVVEAAATMRLRGPGGEAGRRRRRRRRRGGRGGEGGASGEGPRPTGAGGGRRSIRRAAARARRTPTRVAQRGRGAAPEAGARRPETVRAAVPPAARAKARGRVGS